MRVSGLSALGGEEQEDVDAEFLSDDFIKNCTQMDVEVRSHHNRKPATPRGSIRQSAQHCDVSCACGYSG